MAIGWAIVSTGRHPDRKMAPAIRAAQGAELVAVYSRERARAEEFAQKHGAQAAYDSVEALLQDPRVDVVYVASPNHLHAPYTLMAAEAGKHVLCEKPLALTVEDAVSMVRRCRERGVRLGTCFHLRHHPGHQEARRLVQEGYVGTVALATAAWGYGPRGMQTPPPRRGREEWWDRPEMVGAGSMMANGVHGVDLLRYVLGQEVVEVLAMTDGQRPGQPLEHLGVVALRFADGAIGSIVTSRRIPDPRNDLVVYGSQARVSVLDSLSTVLQGTLEVVGASGVERQQPYGPDDTGMYRRMVEAFGQAVEAGREPSASGVDGLLVTQITAAYVESASTGRAVRLEPVEL